jgi:hypothetical protein
MSPVAPIRCVRLTSNVEDRLSGLIAAAWRQQPDLRAYVVTDGSRFNLTPRRTRRLGIR